MPYFASRLEFNNFKTALLGNLISPSRGLFVYVPITLFVIYTVARYWERLEHRALALLALAVIAIHLVATSGVGRGDWWGGLCYGPRLQTDLIPWFVLLAILGLDATRRYGDAITCRREAAAGILLLMIGVAINARGACSTSTISWITTLSGRHSERMFDWRYPQFLAGLIEPPRH